MKKMMIRFDVTNAQSWLVALIVSMSSNTRVLVLYHKVSNTLPRKEQTSKDKSAINSRFLEISSMFKISRHRGFIKQTGEKSSIQH